jgi:FKBP-type peptidyl-prolyl cis-trans isomerases 2
VKITNSKNAQHIVTQGNVVSLAYTITDSEGVEVDSTTESGPFQYIQGSKMLILGLQNALEGKQVGDTVETELDAKNGFGERQKDLVQHMEKALFQVDEIRPGMQFSIMTEDGLRIATIDSLDGNDVIVDLNHPLSGKDIMIKSKILGIRKATDEELRREEINQ